MSERFFRSFFPMAKRSHNMERRNTLQQHQISELHLPPLSWKFRWSQKHLNWTGFFLVPCTLYVNIVEIVNHIIITASACRIMYNCLNILQLLESKWIKLTKVENSLFEKSLVSDSLYRHKPSPYIIHIPRYLWLRPSNKIDFVTQPRHLWQAENPHPGLAMWQNKLLSKVESEKVWFISIFIDVISTYLFSHTLWRYSLLMTTMQHLVAAMADALPQCKWKV